MVSQLLINMTPRLLEIVNKKFTPFKLGLSTSMIIVMSHAFGFNKCDIEDLAM